MSPRPGLLARLRPALRLLYTCGLLLAGVAAGWAGVVRPADLRPSDWQDQVTLATGWEYARGEVGGAWATVRSGARALELPAWTAVSLPHCVNATDAVDPDVPYYQGPAWYRTQLDVANPHPGGRTLLHFEGSGQKTSVWIGTELAGEHTGGYDEFLVDITDAVARYRAAALAKLPAAETNVAPGKIPLAVRCDNARDPETIPSDLSDFNRYGGLYRPVHLVYLPAGGLVRVHATPAQQPDGTWQVALKVFFYRAYAGDRSYGQEITARVVDPAGREIAAVKLPAPAGASELALPAIAIPQPQPWSATTPALYGVEVAATGPGGPSRVRDRFGLRTFEFVEKGPFKLNGERLLLRGTHRHEDHAGLGAAMTDELMEQEVRLMKAMGVNFIRLGHYQQSRRILELCDELGLLAWEEIPWCRGGLGGERYQAQARGMLAAMIDQHYNHPAVILWGLGNENDWPGDFPEFDPAKIRAFMTELNALAHRLDPARKTTIRRCDFCRDLVDVYSPSIWAGWYGGQFSEYATSVRREFDKSARLFHAEWGGDSHAGRHAEDPYAKLRDIPTTGATEERGLDFMDIGGKARVSRDGDWSESYICELIDWHLKEQEKMDWLTGSAMWVFKDFSTPLRPENPVPRVNQKGAVERDLTPKESYYVYQSYWAEAPMVRIYGHSWPVRWGKAGQKSWVHVYSNCSEVELWLNGVSQGARQRDSQDFPAAGLRWAVPLEDGINTIRAVAKRGGQVLADEVTFRFESRPWGGPDHLRLQQLPAAEGRVRVQVELLDKAGVVCLDADDTLRFGHAGDGRLLDHLGTAGGSRQVQLANGRAQIDAALPPGGRAVVSATVANVPTAWLLVTSPDAAAQAASTALRAKTADQIIAELVPLERDRVLGLAAEAMKARPVSLRSVPLPAFAVGYGAQAGDFVSMGDYWWPNPKTPDGLPYISLDGRTNPDNFIAHRMLMREMRDAVATLAAAYRVSGDAAYAVRAAEWLRVFFVDPATRMNPHLKFAQGVPGVTSGRSYGIIDTLHLAEVALAADAIAAAPGVPPETAAGVRAWFGAYTDWMMTSAPGRTEGAARNNHSVAYWLQIAAFARLTGDTARLEETRRVFLEVLLPAQLAADGSFPRELARTKPYGYSIFQLDNVAALTELLSTPQNNLWNRPLPDGRSVAQAVAFLAPYLADRGAWPYAADLAHFESWPIRQPALLFGGYRLGRADWLATWRRLPADSADQEVRRNMAVTQPLLWLPAGR
jgi:beta-galactosidase